MAILATLFGVIGRFAGKLLTMSLGWASVLLFGRVPRDKQIFLAAITFGSVIWIVLILLLPFLGSILYFLIGKSRASLSVIFCSIPPRLAALCARAWSTRICRITRAAIP